ncbi:MAG: protein kinase [Acidobacteriota bacterium]
MADISPDRFHTTNMPATNELLQEGRYRIRQIASHSAHETIYDAFDTVQGSSVILKEIPVRLNKVATAAQRDNQKKNFIKHASLLAEIKHDSILHVSDYFSEIDRQFLVMETFEGDDLATLIQRNNTPFPMADVLAWADEILDALNYLHTAAPPIIHQAIRPESFILRSNGRVKLSAVSLGDGGDRLGGNFKAAASDQDSIRYSPLELIWESLDPASQKVIINNFDERSERILREPADARSDIYSLGATLYRLMTAREPVDALERAIEMIDGKQDPLVEPVKADPRIPDEISEVLMKAMEVKRQNRFDSAAIMRQVLKTAMVRVLERERAEALKPSAPVPDIMPNVIQPVIPSLKVDVPRLAAVPVAVAADADDELLDLEIAPIHVSASALSEVENPIELDVDELIKKVPRQIDPAPKLPEPEKPAETYAVRKVTLAPVPDFELPNSGGKFSFGIPAMAAAAAVIALIAIGGWVFLSSPAEPAVQVTTSAPAIQTDNIGPASAATPEIIDPEVSTSSAPAITAEIPTEQPAVETSPTHQTPQAKQKKVSATAPAIKTPEKPKKTVTADDLINDN